VFKLRSWIWQFWRSGKLPVINRFFLGNNYILQSATNLASTNWVTATDAVPVTAFTVTNGSPARFFRLVQP
jgi:hypothetical protein